MPQKGSPLLFFLDAGVPPLSALVNSHLEGVNARLYHDGRIPSQVATRVNRLENETQLIVLFPNNPITRESVTRYLETMKSVYARVADGCDAIAPARNGAGTQQQSSRRLEARKARSAAGLSHPAKRLARPFG
jgi:hypothetical protein